MSAGDTAKVGDLGGSVLARRGELDRQQAVLAPGVALLGVTPADGRRHIGQPQLEFRSGHATELASSTKKVRFILLFGIRRPQRRNRR
jgi:hypothetical protein